MTSDKKVAKLRDKLSRRQRKANKTRAKLLTALERREAAPSANGGLGDTTSS